MGHFPTNPRLQKKNYPKFKKKNFMTLEQKKKKKISSHVQSACDKASMYMCVYMYVYTETTTKPSPIKE